MRKAGLADDLNLLLDDLCTEWGFCNQLRANALLAPGHVLSADDFAAAVLQAEGMSAEHEVAWRRRIKVKFAERYGASVSEEIYALESNA